jgi:hypothetical protein
MADLNYYLDRSKQKLKQKRQYPGPLGPDEELADQEEQEQRMRQIYARQMYGGSQSRSPVKGGRGRGGSAGSGGEMEYIDPLDNSFWGNPSEFDYSMSPRSKRNVREDIFGDDPKKWGGETNAGGRGAVGKAGGGRGGVKFREGDHMSEKGSGNANGNAAGNTNGRNLPRTGAMPMWQKKILKKKMKHYFTHLKSDGFSIQDPILRTQIACKKVVSK